MARFIIEKEVQDYVLGAKKNGVHPDDAAQALHATVTLEIVLCLTKLMRHSQEELVQMMEDL